MIRSRMVVVAGVIALLPACTGGETRGERPLTSDEAAAMAAVQYSNLQVGGAKFEIAAAVAATGESVAMSGSVDWATHTGRATVTARGREAPVTEVAWVGDRVFERRADTASLLPGLGYPADAWILRPLAPSTRSIDRIIVILDRLSSTEPDNAILIQQTEGSAWLRNDSLRGRDATVVRYGRQTIYWLDAGTSELLRFEGNNAALNAPVVIDLLERGRRTIEPPRPGDVVAVTEIEDLYRALTNP